MKIAIVTGASSGLGSEFVRQIRKQEKLDEIWVVARRKDRLTALEKELQTHLRIITGDLTKAETLHEIEAMLWKEKPDVRILINAAGYGKIGSWRDIKRVDVDGMIDLNCQGGSCHDTDFSAIYETWGAYFADLFDCGISAVPISECLCSNESIFISLQQGAARGTLRYGNPCDRCLSLLDQGHRVHREGKEEQ